MTLVSSQTGGTQAKIWNGVFTKMHTNLRAGTATAEGRCTSFMCRFSSSSLHKDAHCSLLYWKAAAN